MAKCLHCGETPESIKRDQILLCGIVDGYEYRELREEWPRHRWADWTDRDLARFGVKPEAYDRHRRTPELDMQWIACDDTARGHAPVTTDEDVELWDLPKGQCVLCGHIAEPDVEGGDRG